MTKLKDFLRKRGSTQNEAAGVLGISAAALSAKAQGKSPYKSGEMRKLAEHYQMTDAEVREVFLCS